ncbi:unnamed protein product [Adineta steineri]|uniref:Uncharacterized protein n=1 Tax=Adineta steineri TaxID=433720 RepID=A0A818V4J3_9BILA|nr:unnamed protein product [Adineta steineri]CAF3707071.1 unnamed protein product [Adineta steineri]
MAVNGMFTYEDLYAHKSIQYRHKLHPQVSSLQTSSSFIRDPLISEINQATAITVPTLQSVNLTSSTTDDIESSAIQNKLADIIPFTYFYWVLVALAILLTLTLIIIFICYCRTFCKNRRNRRSSLPSFHRYRTENRRVHSREIYRSKIPSFLPAPTPPCPSKSLASLNNQLHGQDLDSVVSPEVARLGVYRNEPLSTFSNPSSNQNSFVQNRLSARSSDPPLKIEQLYEAQRASMAVDDDDDDLKADIVMIDIE